MDSGLNLSVGGLSTSERRMEAITHNLANLGTTGFKRFLPVTTSTGRGAGANSKTTLVTDWSQGELRRTGNPLDLALDGAGFFVLETEKGPAYTRAGSFHLDEQGVLQSEDGFAVAWSAGAGSLQAIGDPIVVDPRGVVRQGANEVGRLKVVDFDERERLVRIGSAAWMAPRGMQEKEAEASVHQGALEQANANSMDELVSMIVAQRHFENGSTVMRTIDQSYKRLNQPK
jgi:flagellar basal body rod protein FlgG